MMTGFRNDPSRSHSINQSIIFQPEMDKAASHFTFRNDYASNNRNDMTSARGGQNTSMSNIIFQQDDVESAGKLVDAFIQQDNAFPKLTTQLNLSEQSTCSVSGLSDNDYPCYALEGLPQISTVSKVPLPNELVEQFRHMQCNCMMGLFPEVNRAWLTIDGDIFVWNFEDGSDLAYFDGLSETILCVGLVRPKPGIFRSHIEYLLCLATPLEIALLGVTFKKPSGDSFGMSEMHLLPDPLFSLPTDNCHIITIQGSSSGRIFMGSKDGSVYELIYQAEDGWFSRRCRKVNHSCSTLSFLVPGFVSHAFSENDAIAQIAIDESRNILYTRSEKGAIQVYDLDIDGCGMHKVAAISQHTIIQNAVAIAKTIDRSNFHPIVDITPVKFNQSANIHLVAITKSGVRLYFSTNNRTVSPKDPRPQFLNLLHVRLPPGFSSNSPPQMPKNVHKAQYSTGTTLLVASQTEDTDVLWTLSNDSFPFQKMLIEKQVTTCLDGHTWALSELPTADASTFSLKEEPPAVVTQHFIPPKKFVFLSAQGSHMITKLRPVDQLRKILEENHGPDSDLLKAYFSVHGVAQSCATALILACSTSIQDSNIAGWATQAFLMYGCQMQPQQGLVQPAAATAFNTPTLFSPNITSFTPHHASTPHIYQSPAAQQPINVINVMSGRHHGLYIYFSRIVRNLWNHPLVCEQTIKSPQGSISYLNTRISSQDLSTYIEYLTKLKNFVEINFRFSSNVDSSVSQYTQNQYTTPRPGLLDKSQHNAAVAEAEIQEKKSLLQLQQLISRVCQVLGMWKIVCDHQIHVLVSTLTNDQQNRLRSTTFREFIASGMELATVIVNKLIAQYLDDNATTDAISGRLREVCPSIYRSEDVDCSKALEKIIAARKVANAQDKDQLLRESLQLCKRITPQLNLAMVATQFQSVHYYDGIVDLCLTAATNRDPQNLAVHYHKNGEPVEDQQGMHAYIMRLEAYKIITNMLGQLLTSSMSHPQSPSVPKQPGAPPVPDPNMLSPQQASQYAEKIFQLALQSSDELFHYALYDWLVEMKFTERLLQIKSAYLETYLKRSQQPQNLAMLDLLWQYYEKNRNFPAAANILAKLAERHGTDVNLQQRIEYLSRATICIKSSDMRSLASNDGELLHELEEKMEVAKIQLKVVEQLQRQAKRSVNAEEAVGRLNADLYDISELYEQFAEPFALPQCQLAILHCAGHHDTSLIERLWQMIIDKEFAASASSSGDAISNKIKALGRMYQSPAKFFPLAFLIKYLEKKSCEGNMSVDWVINTFFSMGISLPVLLENYNKIYKSKESRQVMKRPLHLLEVILRLITIFGDQPTTVSEHERRAFVTASLDAISSYLVDLQSSASSDASSSILMANFKSLQLKLERI